MKQRYLVVFGNIECYGQERITIEIFRRLKSNSEILFLVHHRWGKLHIVPELEKFGLKWKPLKFMAVFRKDHSLKTWIINISRFFTGNVMFYKILKRFKPDMIYFANDFFMMQFLPTLLLKRKYYVLYYAMDRPLSHYGIYRFLWRKFISKRINRSWAVTNYIKEYLIKAGVDKNKIEVVYSPIQKRQIKNKFFLPKKAKFRVSYIGQIIREKGVDLFVEAAKKIIEQRDDVEFVIAGNYNRNEFGRRLKANVENSRFKNKIIFVGYVEDVYSLFESTDVLVLPSIKEEPLGSVLLEAKSAGVPAVVFPSGGLPEIISHKKDGYICKERSADSLVEGITYLLEHPIDREAVKQSLNKFRFDFSNISPNLTNFNKEPAK